MAHAWDAATGHYLDAAGRDLSDQAIRDAIDELADLSSQRIGALATRLQSGIISLADFQQGLMAEIKAAHVAAGVAAHGGRLQMAPADWLVVARSVKSEYSYARAWAGQVADGAAPLDGRLISRAAMYGQAARSTYSDVVARDARVRGQRFERNILGGRPCPGCRAESARGTVPIGSLTPIGARSPCTVNCRCRIEWAMEDVGA